MTSSINLNDGQQAAYEGLKGFFSRKVSQEAKLEGEAGTGKTYVLKSLLEDTKAKLVFTAPTNKATKVIKKTLEGKARTCTTYSLLGLKMTPQGEVKALTGPNEDEINLTEYSGVVVDEASMVNAELRSYIINASELFKLPILYVGDVGQLPPVKESTGPLHQIKDGWVLTEQHRNAGPILRLAREIRSKQNHPAPSVTFKNDVEGAGAVLSVSGAKFLQTVAEEAEQFLIPERQKIIAWRNVTVDMYNDVVRKALFKGQAVEQWLPGERVILTEPAKDFLEDGPMLAQTDDEGTVKSVIPCLHPLFGEIRVNCIKVELDTNRTVDLYVLDRAYQTHYLKRKAELADAAKIDRRNWGKYWEFVESFHSLRYAYAITAHRSQGSTYESTFVDWRDILLNRNRKEAFQCLYVAATRPKQRLVVG